MAEENGKVEKGKGRKIDAEEFPVDGCQQLKGCYLTPGHGNTGALKTKETNTQSRENM